MLKRAEEEFDGKDNIVLSPLSASFALSMLANGAAGETRREIADVLGFDGTGMAEVNEYNRMLLTRLPDMDNTGIMAFANSLWLNSGYGAGGFDVYDEFENELVSNYDAVVYAYDFADGPGIINKWGSDMTNGLIPELLKELDADAQMALANALYFKGSWKNDFQEKLTKVEFFTGADGSSRQVDMMNSRRGASYWAGEKYRLAELAYGNGAFSFQIVLPEDGVTIEELLESISGVEWLEAQANLEGRAIELKLPKFNIEMNESLNGILASMGMKSMFYNADFSNLSNFASVVSNVRQATYFSLDEKGSEAAAVTVIGMVESAGPGGEHKEPEYIPFHVTRPFLFVLKETSTNSILFIGKVTKL